MVSAKIICAKCKKVCRCRGSVRYKGIRYCNQCYKNKTGQIGIGCYQKLKDVKDKVRNVKTYVGRCVVSLPSCYDGKKVRVVVVENEDE